MGKDEEMLSDEELAEVLAPLIDHLQTERAAEMLYAHVAALRAEHDQALALLATRTEALRAVEWDANGYCRYCSGDGYAHNEWCRVAAALADDGTGAVARVRAERAVVEAARLADCICGDWGGVHTDCSVGLALDALDAIPAVRAEEGRPGAGAESS